MQAWCLFWWHKSKRYLFIHQQKGQDTKTKRENRGTAWTTFKFAPIRNSHFTFNGHTHLNVNLWIHLAEVVHYTVQVQLSGTQDDVFPRLLHLDTWIKLLQQIMYNTGAALYDSRLQSLNFQCWPSKAHSGIDYVMLAPSNDYWLLVETIDSRGPQPPIMAWCRSVTCWGAKVWWQRDLYWQPLLLPPRLPPLVSSPPRELVFSKMAAETKPPVPTPDL